MKNLFLKKPNLLSMVTSLPRILWWILSKPTFDKKNYPGICYLPEIHVILNNNKKRETNRFCKYITGQMGPLNKLQYYNNKK